jgi:hypothetical protein
MSLEIAYLTVIRVLCGGATNRVRGVVLYGFKMLRWVGVFVWLLLGRAVGRLVLVSLVALFAAGVPLLARFLPDGGISFTEFAPNETFGLF